MVRLKPGGQTKQKGLGDRPLSRGTLTCVPPGPGHLRKQVGPASEPLSRAGVDPTHSSNAGPKPLLGTQICEAKGRLSVPPRLAALRPLPPLLVSGNGTGRQPRPLGNSVTSPPPVTPLAWDDAAVPSPPETCAVSPPASSWTLALAS